MAAYMEFDLNDSQASYSPSSSSPSIGRLSVWSDPEDDKSKPCSKFCDHQFGQANEGQDRQVEEEDHEDSDHGSYKWMPSKMRILRKMMSCNGIDQGSNSSPVFEGQKRSPLEAVDHNQSNTTHKRSSSFKSLTNDTVRVCSDCNTTKTPLWRSGPRGPKSLCNACGIRQRKARRAMAAAAAAAANGTVLQVPTPPLKIKLKHKNKRPKIDLCDTPSNKRRQVTASRSSDGVGEHLIRFEDFTSRILSENYSGFEKVFPQDEKEAAILLMALSCGLVCSS